MKKLLGAGAAAVLALSWAGSALAEDLGTKTNNAAKDVERGAKDVGKDVSDGAEKAWDKTKEGAKDTSSAISTKADEVGQDLGMATESQGTFRDADAYDLRGTLKKPVLGSVSIERRNLPKATLDVRSKTKVTLDGRPVKISDIPEGAPVRARFQLEGTDTVAISIEATSVAGTKTKK